MTPPRLTHVVEAFEVQASLEQDADDLDYDASGRLKFSAEINDKVADAKGAAQVARMKYTRRRRYGASHIGARTRQIDELLGRIDAYLAALRAQTSELTASRATSLWLDPPFIERVLANLEATHAMVAALRDRALRSRALFESLPRLDVDPLRVPEPLPDETLTA